MKSECGFCGKVFTSPPSDKRKYCSRKCYYKASRKKIDEIIAEYRDKKCLCGCGEYLVISRRTVTDYMKTGREIKYKKGHFSRTEEHKKTHLFGEEHPMFGKKGGLSPVWKGGGKKRTDYGKGWETQRRKCRKRDNYTCKRCGATKTRLDIHHKIPFKEFDDFKQANNLDNLICLCYKCHMLVEWRTRFKAKRMNSGKIPLGQS